MISCIGDDGKECERISLTQVILARFDSIYGVSFTVRFVPYVVRLHEASPTGPPFMV